MPVFHMVICFWENWLKYLLTVVGLTPWGSSTVHIYTQTIHRTTQLTTDILTTKRKAIPFSETSVPIYNSTRNNIQEDLNFHRHRCKKPQYPISLLQLCRYSLGVASIPSDSSNTANSFHSWKLKAGRLSWERSDCSIHSVLGKKWLRSGC